MLFRSYLAEVSVGTTQTKLHGIGSSRTTLLDTDLEVEAENLRDSCQGNERRFVRTVSSPM